MPYSQGVISGHDNVVLSDKGKQRSSMVISGTKLWQAGHIEF